MFIKRIQLNLCQYWSPIWSKKDFLIVLLFHTCQIQTVKYNQQQLHSNVSNMFADFFVGNPMNLKIYNSSINLRLLYNRE